MKKYAAYSPHDFKMENIKGIILDYGGTIDSHGVHWSEIIWDNYSKCGVPVDKETFRHAYVETERELARHRHILPHHNFRHLMEIKIGLELDVLVAEGHISPEMAQKFTNPVAWGCYEAARSTIESCRPTLEFLYERWPMVLVSNFYGNVNSVLDDFGIKRYFKDVIESAVVGVRKPDPKIFQLGVDSLNLKPQQVLVVGDSYRKDIIPAASIGCRTAWLKGRGWDDDDQQTTTADTIIINKLNELTDVLL